MMEFYLDSHTYGPVLLKNAVPATLSKYAIQGSRRYSIEEPFGDILIQQFDAGDAILYYTVSHIRRDLALDFSAPGPFTWVHIALENESRADMTGIDTGTFFLNEGQFNMIRSDAASGTIYMEENNDYRALSIYCTGGQCQQLFASLPFPGAFFDKKRSPEPALLFNNHPSLDTQGIDLVNHLLHCQHKGIRRQLFFEKKTRELLLLLIGREQTDAVAPGLNNRILEAISEARLMLEKGGSTAAFHKIARKIGISEVNLKGGLQFLYGLE